MNNGIDPVVLLSYSDNGGRIFKGDFARGIGKIGEYGQQTVWNRQGRFPVSRSVQLTVTDPVRANLIRLAASAEVGTQ